MTTPAQDTHPQHPVDPFTLHMEEIRRMPVPRGVAGIVHMFFVEFFTVLARVLARRAEERRNGTLPEPASPECAPEQPSCPRPSYSRPAELRPRENGWAEQRHAEATLGGGTSRAPREPTEIAAETSGQITEPPCETPLVERPVTANVCRWLPLTPALFLKGRGRSTDLEPYFESGVVAVRFWHAYIVPI